MTADDVRLRLRDLLQTRGVTQTELTRRLTKASGETWLIDHVSKLLRGEIRLRVEDVVLMCEVAGISLVELFREPGREYVADLTPTELRQAGGARLQLQHEREAGMASPTPERGDQRHDLPHVAQNHARPMRSTCFSSPQCGHVTG